MIVDTNVLLRMAQVTSTDHLADKSAVLALERAGFSLCIVPQVLYEFWVVATGPANVNGLGKHRSFRFSTPI